MLANGGYIAGVIEKIYGRKQVLCPAGCHPQPLKLLRSDSESVYQGYFKVKGQTITKPYVLITNRHEPQKKFESVIQAMAEVSQSVPHASLVIPGPFTAHTAKLIELARELGIGEKVLFLGQIPEPELQRLYREAAVYCYPAPEEDFGMGVIEAMAWGIPVVAWNHAGPTVTVLDGVTGFLAEPGKIESYAQAVAWLLMDPALRARMGAAAHERTVRYFSWERHVRILEKAIRRAAGEPVEVKVPLELPVQIPVVAIGTGPLARRALPRAAADLGELQVTPIAAPELAEMGTGPLAGG
jgi:glycosyltransferase involved in cell wall biosynthesis